MVVFFIFFSYSLDLLDEVKSKTRDQLLGCHRSCPQAARFQLGMCFVFSRSRRTKFDAALISTTPDFRNDDC